MAADEVRKKSLNKLKMNAWQLFQLNFDDNDMDHNNMNNGTIKVSVTIDS